MGGWELKNLKGRVVRIFFSRKYIFFEYSMILCIKKDRYLRKIEKNWQINFGGGRYTATTSSPP